MTIRRFEIYLDLAVRIGIINEVRMKDLLDCLTGENGIVAKEKAHIVPSDREAIAELEKLCRQDNAGAGGTSKVSIRNVQLLTRMYRLALENSSKELPSGQIAALRAVAFPLLAESDDVEARDSPHAPAMRSEIIDDSSWKAKQVLIDRRDGNEAELARIAALEKEVAETRNALANTRIETDAHLRQQHASQAQLVAKG